MKKEETIKMYQEAYLAGRSDEARTVFLAKSVAKQYSCIMAWRHRMRHSNKTTDGSEIIDHLRVARKRLGTATEINEQESTRSLLRCATAWRCSVPTARLVKSRNSNSSRRPSLSVSAG